MPDTMRARKGSARKVFNSPLLLLRGSPLPQLGYTPPPHLDPERNAHCPSSWEFSEGVGHTVWAPVGCCHQLDCALPGR